MSAQEKQSVTATVDKDIAMRIKHLRTVIGNDESLKSDIQNALQSILISHEQKHRIQPDSWLNSRICPKCSKGVLVLRRGARGLFLGCSDFPICNHTANYEENKTDKKVKGKNDRPC